MKKVIMVCQQKIPFSISPARYQMIDELQKRNCFVTVFSPGKIDDFRIRKKINRFVNTEYLSNFQIKNKIREMAPDIVIGYTIEDAIICSTLPYRMKSTRFYYYNLEIYVFPDKNSFFLDVINTFCFLKNKMKEKVFVKGCKALVIQDPLRKNILKKYGISHSKTFLIPNSYYCNNEHYDVEHVGGLIYTGGLDRCLLESFMENLKQVRDIKITLSGWKSKWLLDNYINKLKKYPNIELYMNKLPVEKYTKFISAYDIAFIWYSDKSIDNVYNIGLSSGKFFKHLSIGQPVIVVNFPGIAEEVRKHKLGIVIDDLSELKDAINEIQTNYNKYFENVKAVYEMKYDFGKVSKKFFDFITES